MCWVDLLAEAKARLDAALGPDRAQEARWLIERVSGYGPAELVVRGNEPVGTRSVAFFDQLLARRVKGEPLQYVLGRWAFRTLDLFVDANVLIPRPETEMVAGLAIDALRIHDAPLVADLGTGSGAIACSLAVELPTARVWASDVSRGALQVARANVAGLGRAGARVTVCEGSWFDALPEDLIENLDVIISNPPYVASTDWLPAEVRDWEPALALFGPGPEGHDHIEHLIDRAPQWLAPGGTLVIEMQPNQTEWAVSRAIKAGLLDTHVVCDLADRPRALVATKSVREIKRIMGSPR